MGSEDLFHRRKARKITDLARKKASCLPYDRVLIVCEGAKTEPNYFEEMRECYELSTANIEITGECGSNPGSILQYARDLYRESCDKGIPFDRVYCVFDRDMHSDYEETLRKISELRPFNTFSSVRSVPCFEYWLLLHFTYTTKAYEGLPSNSSGTQVVSELKNYIPDYGKGMKGVFINLSGQLDFAINNSKRAVRAANDSGSENPSTYVHELVEYLMGIKVRK
ncbi:RloB family protein [Serratia fonticola]|uniref:RloB family protein n=1 Tax=Serratia fonticola TaxID=47917 RepID=UPI001C478C0A|nr:RloB family protein [Serratia fonticola]QXN62316.1 RloB domain-containing protein [Serratia fonticola]